MKHRGFLGSETTLDDTMMLDTCRYTFIQTQRMCTSQSDSYGSWWALGDWDVSVCVFIGSNKCNCSGGRCWLQGRLCVRWGGGGSIRKLPVLSALFCWESKIALGYYLAVQWLGLFALTTEGRGFDPASHVMWPKFNKKKKLEKK